MKFRGAKPPFMENKKLMRFVESFVLLPVMTISMSQGVVPKESVKIVTPTQTVFSQKLNKEALSLFAFNPEVDKEAETIKTRAEAIDSYFKAHDMPLAGKGQKMAEVAKKYELDWRLIPAISYIETSGGKHMCKNPDAQNNPFGWGSCAIGFSSIDEAIEVVGKNLSGENPKTAKHYDNKSIKGILEAYNPPRVVPGYANKVMKIMSEIGDANLGEQTEAQV